MIKLNEVLELVRAGYTKAEIAAMTEAPQPEETAAPAVQPEVQEEHTEAQAGPAPAAAPEAPVDHNAAILEAINKLSNAVITNNINTQTQPENTGRTIEQALAEIISPPPAKKREI